MEPAQRANAAQLAARNIKARPRSRRTGSKPPDSTTQQQFPPMSTPSQNGGGGLFGGSIQAPGEFNFSAPAQGLNLPQPAFGPRSSTMNTQSSDSPENEGRFAGDDRATKRLFGGSSTAPESNSGFQTSTPFGQSQPSNPFGSTQQSSGGSMFPFGGSQQSGASAINFNSGSGTPSKPADNPFSFQPASQPTPSAPSNSFASGPFNFNQQSAQAQNSPGKFEFTAAATAPFSLAPAQQQDELASSPFLFGQTSGQGSSSGNNFGSTATTAPPANSLFGSTPATTTAAPKSNLFGSAPTATTASPTSNAFGSTTTTAPPTSNLFGSTPTTIAPQDKPASSPFSFSQSSGPPSSSGINFGSTPATAPPTSILFGSTQSQQSTQSTGSFGSGNQQTSSSSNPFAHLNVPASPASTVFGTQEQKRAAPATSNLFGTQSPVQAQTTSNVFGNATQTPTTSTTSNLFGQQKPQPSPSSNMFGNVNKPTASNAEFNIQNQNASAGSAFGNKESKLTNDLFGNLNKPLDQSVTQHKADGRTSENGTNPSLFSNPPSVSNIFGASKSLFPPTPAKQAEPATNGTKPALSFGSTQPAAPQTSGKTSSPMKPIDAPSSASQPPPNGMFPSLEQIKSPQKLNEPSFISATPATSSAPRPSQRESLLREKTLVRQQMKEAADITDESLAHLVPGRFSEFQKKKLFTSYRMRTLNIAMGRLFAILSHDEDVIPDMEFYKEQRGLIMADSPTLKRKIGEDGSEQVDHASKRPKQSSQSTSTESHEQHSKRKLDDEEDQENENPSKRTRQIESSGSARGLTNGEVKSNGQTSTPADGNNFQPWKAPSSGLPPTSETPLKRKAEDQITKDSVQRSPLRPMKTPKTNGTVESTSSGSTTSNLFRNILDSPSKSPGKNTPEKKMAALPEPARDDKSRDNPFANLPGVSTLNKSAPAPSPSTFATKATSGTSTVSSQNLFASKAMSETPNMFAQKPAAPSNAAVSPAIEQESNVLKPPTFDLGTSSNFQEQFNQKANETEQKALQKAIDEDYDSDEDREEFIANFRAKRLAERKAIEESAKNFKGFQVVQTPPIFGTGSSSSQAGSNPAKITSEPSSAAAADSSNGKEPPFGQHTSSQASGNSVFSSLNGSRTSTPGLNGSSTGSVLDGHTPGKASKYGGIFGYLSDADSGKGDDADDESGDDVSDPEGDSEKKDPTYQPDGQNVSGPGTPVEETGAGIASAKKTNPFALGAPTFGSASPSGTSSPGGSLFDRITKDSNGNVVRHISTEEKENTQPSTANLFGDIKNPFNKSVGPAGDNTWKPDSPIRFGSATSHKDDQEFAPTVSVTAATPTKTGSPPSVFGGLNNNTNSVEPLSSLFGNIGGDSKPAASFSTIFGTPSNATGSTPGNVGFAFGASSTTSSLFPSAAASATTSRATTPGGTTDGDNSGDGGAETEQHDQIDLTAGGPGEEDEEVVHEVRAKGLKFSPKQDGDNSNQWETKGVGPLRVLKHKETGVSRILLRADPRGTIVLNKGLLSGVKYEAQKKTVKFMTAGDHGKGLETWILQVKTPESAEALAEVLEANKAT